MSREAFEKWYAEASGVDVTEIFYARVGDEYFDAFIRLNTAWMAWQAALESQEDRIAELQQDLQTTADALGVAMLESQAAQPQVPDDCVLVTVCTNRFTSAKLIPLVQVQSSSLREVARYADQAWREVESALTASQEKNKIDRD